MGPPESNAFIGPVVNKTQFDKIQGLIRKGIDEGATPIIGGPGKPEELENGYDVRPTIFADTTPEMTIAREEIFRPVLVIQAYDSVDDAVTKANDTDYGLAAYFQGGDIEELRQIAARVPAGQVYLNGTGLDIIDFTVPFGGFKRSGNGRVLLLLPRFGVEHGQRTRKRCALQPRGKPGTELSRGQSFDPASQ